MSMPTFEHHGDNHIECKLNEIIHLLNKLNRKVERLNPDFTREDKLVKGMSQKLKEAEGRLPSDNQKGQ